MDTHIKQIVQLIKKQKDLGNVSSKIKKLIKEHNVVALDTNM